MIPILTAKMSDADYQVRLSHIRGSVTPSRVRSPGSNMESRKNNCREEDRDYFNIFVGNVLEVIRGKQIDYLFSEDQVAEILRYEPDAKIRYLSDYMWEVFLC